LDIATRLGLVRQIAEALQYAHEHRLYHRALSPQTLLVTAPASPRPVVKIFDWQTAQRDSISDSTPRPTTEDSWQLGLFGDPQSLLYMAPEAIAGMASGAPKLDFFPGCYRLPRILRAGISHEHRGTAPEVPSRSWSAHLRRHGRSRARIAGSHPV
jgi:serine/threonine protein kinase